MATLQRNRIIWNLELSESDVQGLKSATDKAQYITGLVTPLIPPPIDALLQALVTAVSTAVEYIGVIDDVGGDQGVDITGVIGTAGCITTPAGPVTPGGIARGAFDLLKQAGTGVSVQDVVTIGEFVLKVAYSVVTHAISITNPGFLVGGLAAGVPGAVLFGWLDSLFSHHDSPPPYKPEMNIVGAVCPNRTGNPGPWETFMMFQVGTGNVVGLLSWQGFFSAQNATNVGTGSPQASTSVFANRPNFNGWEKWTLIRNGDGTVSFLSADEQHCLTAPNGGPAACWAHGSYPPQGDEKFKLQFLGNGNIALRTAANNYLVSVQNTGTCGAGTSPTGF